MLHCFKSFNQLNFSSFDFAQLRRNFFAKEKKINFFNFYVDNFVLISQTAA